MILAGKGDGGDSIFGIASVWDGYKPDSVCPLPQGL